MHKQRILVIVFSCLGALATFLPWFVMSSIIGSHTEDGTKYNGMITFILFLACVVISLFSDIKRPVPQQFFWGIIIASILAGIVGALGLLNADNNSNNLLGVVLKSYVEIGTGFYLLMICSFSIPVVLYLFRK